MQYIKNQFYWIEDINECYIPAKLLNIQPTQNNDYQFEIYQNNSNNSNNNSIIWVNKTQIYGTIPSPGEITLKTLYDDLTESVDISEASVLWNLKQRYYNHNIYSAIGPILIALNPYCNLEDLYSQEKLDYYLNNVDSEKNTHIWAISRAAYLQLKQKYMRQAIVISGESGAGKTETTKKCLQYLSAASMGQAKESPGQTAIEDRVLGSNPLLESFGNSKTCRNNNSSRFGKWLEINFNCGRGKFCLIGANITQYLLEKSRVVTQAEDERNYHIFYQMCSDESMGLGSPENYVYLNQSGCIKIEGVSDYQDFILTKKAFNDLHFSEDDQNAIFNALKAILYLGNVVFEEGYSNSGNCSVVSSDTYHCLAGAANLLGLNENDLTQALTTRTIQARGEIMVKPLGIEQAQDTKNAFVKEIYGRLFSQIVTHANKSLAFSTNDQLESENQGRMKSGKRRLSMQGGVIISIGLLDIFGFEIFTSNSFEQLCINYGNEKLQQYFINYVLKREQETYDNEGIIVERVETTDNQDVLHLLESKPFGVFAMLDEELKLPQGSDQGFIRKVEKEYKDKSSRFRRDFRMKNEQFELHHFAGKVLYDASSFLDKNKDKMYEHLESLLITSTIPKFKEMMIAQSGEILPSSISSNSNSNTMKSSSNKHQRQVDTLASRFTGQLQQLITVLQESEPHFVRCIKPNSMKNPITFEPELVLKQLRYSGVLEAIQIRKSGYPTRKLLNDFLKSYRLLANIPINILNEMSSDSERCFALLENLGKKNPIYLDMKLGKTMVFYRPDVHNALERDKIEVGLRAILSMQSAYRRRKATERVQILWETRRSLQLSMNYGYENQSSNINAIPDLEYWLYYCNQVGLYCITVKEAEDLLQRLQNVKLCLDQLTYLIENGPYIYSEDITLEYSALESAIIDANQLNIIHTTFDQAILRRDQLKTRAIAVLELRSSIESLNEIALEHSIDNINLLIEEYGEFCENEKNNAIYLLSRLKLELSVMNEIYLILAESQQQLLFSIETEIQQNNNNNNSSNNSNNKNSIVNDLLNSSINNVKKALNPITSINNYIHPLSTIPSQNMYNVINYIINIRLNWIESNWKQIADDIVEMTNCSKELWPTDCNLTSESLQMIVQLFTRIIDTETGLVAQGIDVHVILPMLNEGIIKGAINVNLNDISLMTVDIEPLSLAIEKTQTIQTIGEKAKNLLLLVEGILILRKAAADDNYEMMLALTEPSPVTSCRHIRQTKLYSNLSSSSTKKKIHKQSSMGYSLQDLQSNEENSIINNNDENIIENKSPSSSSLLLLSINKPLSNFPLTDLSLLNDNDRFFETMLYEKIKVLSGPFLSSIPNINEEIKIARKYALDKYIQYIITSSLEIPRIIKESNGSIQLILNSDLTQSISLTLDEVIMIWSIESQEVIEKNILSIEKYLSSFSKKLYLISEAIIEARKYLEFEEYEKIIEMNKQHRFDFNIQGKTKDDIWTTKILTLVKEELIITVAEAKNFNAKKSLLNAMKIGSVTGLVGKINIHDISTEELSIAVRIAEQCVNEDPRPITTLKTLVEISKDLIETRRAFQILGSDDQRKLFRILQNHGNNLPIEISEEIKCMGCEVDYRESMTLLEKGLTLTPPIKYLITPSSPNRRQSQAQMRFSMLGNQDNNSILLDVDDELIPNLEILNCDQLQEGLNASLRLRQTYNETTLSPYLISLIDAANLIVKLRTSVLNENWSEGEIILKEIEQSKIIESIPITKLEINEATQVIKNSLLVGICENALSTNQPLPSSVDIGFLDLSKTSLKYIDEAIIKCEETSNKSKRTEILYNALLLMKDLRRSVLNGDWSSIKLLLIQIKQQGISNIIIRNLRNTVSLCGIEIESVRIAALNQESLKSLKTSLIEEMVKGLPGSIEIEKIETYKLTSSLGTVITVAVNDRGEFLSNFYNLADIVLKGRKSANQLQWNVVRSLSAMWKEKINYIKLKSHEIFEELNSNMYGSENSKSVNFQFPFKDYEYLSTILLEEWDLLQNHITMIQLEGEVSKALLENGVSNDMVGQIDLTKIRIDGLQLVLERKDTLLKATNSTLPLPVEKLCKAAHLMLDIRSAILKGYWDKVPNLLEEALTGPYHPLPQACQQEINVIRLECENRWIINTLSTALESNRLNGTVDDYKDTSEVSCEQLNGAITACYTLTPRTDEAISLLRTSEDILKLRSLLVIDEPDWSKIRDTAINLLHNENLHYLGVSEIELVAIVADNIILCKYMEDELTKNSITGKPGNLDLSYVNTNGLHMVCKLAMETSTKSKKSNQLLNACRSVLSLREALLRSAHYPETSYDSLNTVKSIVYSMYEVHTKNPRDAGWLLCRTEIALVTQDAHIQEVTRMLQESTSIACRIYTSRNAASIGSAPNSRRTSVNITETQLSSESLDTIISYISQLDFSSNVLDKLLLCTKSLKLIREAVINTDWELVNNLTSQEDIVQSIYQIPYTVSELNFAKQESHNRITANKLEAVLNNNQVINISSSPNISSSSSNNNNNNNNHEYLAKVIEEAEASDITAMATQQLLECAKNVYILRVGLSSQDNKQVAQALRWFGVNAYRCPVSVQEEAQKAFIMHQNSLLLTGLTSALQTGYASGELGDMNISTVDTTVLSKLLAQAHDVKFQTPEVRDIVDIAEMIYCLRCAQRAKDTDGISKALDMLSSWGKMLPAVVVEEVAFARSERDNALAVSALESTFSTFDVTNSLSLEMSLKSGLGDINLFKLSEDSVNKNSKLGNSTPTSTSTSALLNQKKITGRRYSYASLNRADIDLDTIDINTLDYALNEAKKYGLYTDLAKSLYRTVYTIRSLRSAMKQNDWPKVEEVLNEVDKSYDNPIQIHSLAEKELQVIRNQLEMRTSIVDLSKALKTGWARCNNGIVDTDTLQLTSLIDSIARAERSMQDLGISQDMKKFHIKSLQQPHLSQMNNIGGKTDISASLTVKDDQQSKLNQQPVSSPSIKRYRKHFPTSDSSNSNNLRKKALIGDRDKERDRKEEVLPDNNNNNNNSTNNNANNNSENVPKSKVQEQVEKLLLSAGIVAEVRKALHSGYIQLAGELSEEALQIPELHSSVQEELTHYATEIGRALCMMKICSELREAIKEGSGEELEKVLNQAREASIDISSDLGLVRTMEKAQSVLKSINKVKKELTTISNIYSIQSIEEIIASAKKLNVTGYLIDNAISRLSTLKQFEVGLKDLNIDTGGIVTGRQAQQMIYDLGVSLGIKNHPICRRAAVLLRLNESSLTRVLLAEALANSNSYSAATETIKLKRAFLRLPEVLEEFSIEKFKRLRSSSDFSMRLALESTELKHSMLRHTDGLIETSLTILSPTLAALAVFIFTHTIKVLEENSSEFPEVLLRNLINIGRSCPIMRDEILMQCVKQLRENPLEEYEIRIWTVLKACLKHFPPSDQFENYLECFLLSHVKSKPDLRTILSASCIRNMHENIFHHGYNSKIYTQWDSSLKSVKLLLLPIQTSSDSLILPSGFSNNNVNNINNNTTNNNNNNNNILGNGNSHNNTNSNNSNIIINNNLNLPTNLKKNQVLYSFLDPGFITPTLTSTSISTSSLENPSSPSIIEGMKVSVQAGLRGTRDNWIFRFKLLSQDEEDISMAEFAERLFSPTSKIDRNDRIVLLFWVCKYLPSKSTALSILRELSSDNHLFYSLDITEKKQSEIRKELIRTLPYPDKPLRLDTPESKSLAIKSFWENIICRCVTSDNYLNELRTNYPQSKGMKFNINSGNITNNSIGGNNGSINITNNLKIKNNINGINNNSNNSPHSIKLNRTILSHSISDIHDSSSSSSYLSIDNKDINDKMDTKLILSNISSMTKILSIDESFLTWYLYRDIIIIGMELIALEVEQLQDISRSNNDYLTLLKGGNNNKLKSNNNNNNNNHNFIPVHRENNKSPSPTQRKRRNASHNKLPL